MFAALMFTLAHTGARLVQTQDKRVALQVDGRAVDGRTALAPHAELSTSRVITEATRETPGVLETPSPTVRVRVLTGERDSHRSPV